jgi:hypothetical protein
MRRARAALALTLLGAAAARPLAAGDIAKAVVILEAQDQSVPGDVPKAAPARFVLMEDGTVFVGGTSRVLSARLDGAVLKALDRRLDAVRKLPGLGGTVALGPGAGSYRLLLRKGRPIDMQITGDPAQATGSLRALADLLRDLSRFNDPALQPYQPTHYAMSAFAATLVGGCRPWTFPDPPEGLAFAPRVMDAASVRGWPTGATPASVCAGDKHYAVALRPLLPGETP